MPLVTSRRNHTFASGALEEKIYDDGAALYHIFEQVQQPITSTLLQERFHELKEIVHFNGRALDLDFIPTLPFLAANAAAAFLPTFSYCQEQADVIVEEKMQAIHRQDRVVLFFHGYYQNGNAAQQFVQDAHDQGFTVLAPSYDFRMEPSRFSSEILTTLMRQAAARGATIVGVIGHSTGADNCRYALLHNEEVKDYVDDRKTTFIFSAPIMNGIDSPNRVQKAFFKAGQLWGDADNLLKKIGEEHLQGLNQPVPPLFTAYTFLCRRDLLVPVKCGFDTNLHGNTLIIPYGGHFEGSGVSTRINKEYLRCVEKGR